MFQLPPRQTHVVQHHTSLEPQDPSVETNHNEPLCRQERKQDNAFAYLPRRALFIGPYLPLIYWLPIDFVHRSMPLTPPSRPCATAPFPPGPIRTPCKAIHRPAGDSSRRRRAYQRSLLLPGPPCREHATGSDFVARDKWRPARIFSGTHLFVSAISNANTAHPGPLESRRAPACLW